MDINEAEALQFHLDTLTNIELLMYLDGLNQTRIAKRMRVAQSDVSNILSGKRTLTELWLKRFARALKVKPQILTHVDLKGAILESLRNAEFEEDQKPRRSTRSRKKR